MIDLTIDKDYSTFRVKIGKILHFGTFSFRVRQGVKELTNLKMVSNKELSSENYNILLTKIEKML